MSHIAETLRVKHLATLNYHWKCSYHHYRGRGQIKA